MMSMKFKQSWLPVLIFTFAVVVVSLFFLVRHHYVHSAKMYDDESLKALVEELYSKTDPNMKIVEFREIYKSPAKKIMAVNFIGQKASPLPNDRQFGYYFCLEPDSLFKNRYRIGGGSGAGGEDLNELVADSQTYYDSRLKKQIECVAIRGIKLENIGAKFTIPELGYSGTITDEDYFDIIIIENSNWARSFDIQYED